MTDMRLALVDVDIASALFPFLFPILFAAIWLAITFGLSRASGWSQLARSFSTHKPFERTSASFRFASGFLGAGKYPVRYNNCFSVFISERGLGLRLFFLFGVFCDPLLIPWARIESAQNIHRDFHGFFVVDFFEFRIKCSDIRIGLRSPAGPAAAQAWRSAFEWGRRAHAADSPAPRAERLSALD